MKRILAGLLLAGAASFVMAPAADAHPICTPLAYTQRPLLCVETPL